MVVIPHNYRYTKKRKADLLVATGGSCDEDCSNRYTKFQ